MGKYIGEVLLENGNVTFDNNITGFQDGVSLYGLNNGSMTETDFIEVVETMISEKSNDLSTFIIFKEQSTNSLLIKKIHTNF